MQSNTPYETLNHCGKDVHQNSYHSGITTTKHQIQTMQTVEIF